MLTQFYRPTRFKDVIGQAEAVAVMKAVASRPETAPRAFIFQGERGLGKTSMSRVFARALLCTNKQYGDACLACESCIGFSDMGTSYQEYDSTQVGNVQFMRNLKDRLYYVENAESYTVVVFDEIHTATVQAQNALLKLLEEGPRDTFFLMATTDVDKVIGTIRGRCVELSFVPVTDSEMRMHLESICKKENLDPNRDVIQSIVSFSFGHVRDALMKLDLYKQVGDPAEFLKLVNMPEKDIIELFLAISQQDKERFMHFMGSLLASPLAYLRKSFELFILNALRHYSGCQIASFPDKYEEVKMAFGQTLFELLNILSRDWVYNCFRSDLSFQSFLWYLYNAFTKTKKQEAPKMDLRYQK